MAKPTTVVPGFIEIYWNGKTTLLAISNILAVQQKGDRATVTLNTAIDAYDTKADTVGLSYAEVLNLLREAVR